MSALSDWAEGQIRAHMFRTATYTKPVVAAVALATAATTDAQTGATLTEVPNSNSYARVDRPPLDANWSAPDTTGGLTANVAAITMPAASGSWGTVSHLMIADSATWGAGNSVVHGALTASKAVGTNDILSFAIAALSITYA